MLPCNYLLGWEIHPNRSAPGMPENQTYHSSKIEPDMIDGPDAPVCVILFIKMICGSDSEQGTQVKKSDEPRFKNCTADNWRAVW